MAKNTVKLNEEQLRNIVSESVKRILKEDFGAGMKAVGQRLGDDFKRVTGQPYMSHPEGNYKNTYQDASKNSDAWRLGNLLKQKPDKVNVQKVIAKVQSLMEYGVVSQESGQKVISLLQSGGSYNIMKAGHELKYGTMTFAAMNDDETGSTDYEKRNKIRQL